MGEAANTRESSKRRLRVGLRSVSLGLLLLSGQLAVISHDIVETHWGCHGHEESGHVHGHHEAAATPGHSLADAEVDCSEAEIPRSGPACMVCQLATSAGISGLSWGVHDWALERAVARSPSSLQVAERVYRFAPKTSPPGAARLG